MTDQQEKNVLAHPKIPALGRLKQKDQEFQSGIHSKTLSQERKGRQKALRDIFSKSLSCNFQKLKKKKAK
jgi:hypothetical protein